MDANKPQSAWSSFLDFLSAACELLGSIFEGLGD